MSNYNSLKATIDANIKQNGNQEITGQILNSVLNQMVTTLGTGYQFAGVATIDTNPGTPDAKVFYIANGKGTYTNFGGIEVTEDEVVVLYYDTEWHKEATGIASNEKLSELGENTTNLKEEIIGTEETELNISSFELCDGIIANLKWNYVYGNKSYAHLIIPVNSGTTYSIKAGHANAGYCFLRSYSTPVSGNVPDLSSDYQSGPVSISANTSKVDIEVPTDANYLYILAKVENIDRIPSKIVRSAIEGRMQKVENKVNTYNSTNALVGKLSIIGDSISTFNGYCIDGYMTHYPTYDVTDVRDTYWMQLINSLGLSLEVNASEAGSRSSTVADRHDFYSRVGVIGNPDTILVALGTNDSLINVPIGELEYDKQESELSDQYFAPSYLKGVKALKSTHPNANIVLAIFEMGEEYANVIYNIAEHYRLAVCDCRGYKVGDPEGNNIHPNKKGMLDISGLLINCRVMTLLAIKNSMSKQNANEIAKLDALITPIVDVGELSIKVNSLSLLAGIIQTNKWNFIYANKSYAHAIIPVEPGESFRITAGELNSGYCFLKDYSTPVTGNYASFAQGFNSVVSISAGITEVISVPEDAKYLYILGRVENIDRLPQSIVKQAKMGEISNIKEELSSIKDIIYKAEYSVGSWVFAHINTSGYISPNNNKNIVFENPVLALKGSYVSVDAGYKYQIGLYNKETGAVIRRETWKTDKYVFEDDYLVRLEVSDIAESVLSDFSIAEHLHYVLFSANTNLREEVESLSQDVVKKETINEDYLSLSEQADNLVAIMGDESIIGKKLTIVSPDKYSCWSFIGALKDRVCCVYTKALEHEDADKGAIFSRVSANGIIWTPIKGIIDTLGKRDNVTGIGNDTNGNVLFFNRVGYPTHSDTYFDVYKTSDGFNFEKIATHIFGAGHISNIINVPNVGLMAFFNTYSGRNWGKLVSNDNGVTWTETTIETGLAINQCPVEISAQYLGNGKILAIGRFDDYSGVQALWQMQSSDYGATWTRVATNMVYDGGNTANILYDADSDIIDLYIYRRGNGRLYHVRNTSASIWDNPTNWASGEVIASGGTGSDSGNVNAVKFNNKHIVSFYSGSQTETGIYEVIVE